MPIEPVRVDLSDDERGLLQRLVARPSAEHRMVMRARIVLAAADGQPNRIIARQLGLSVQCVRKWRRRFIEQRLAWPDRPVLAWLADAQRCGAPLTFSAEFWVDLLGVLTLDPSVCGRPITHWTTRELADEVVIRRLCDTIDHSTVARFLAAADIKPHRVRGWMNRKDDPDFEQRAENVKRVLLSALEQGAELEQAAAKAAPEIRRLVVSFDEKTGMQAKERIAPTQPMKAGQPARQEFEYRRHGTLCLFGAQLVHTGEVVATTSEQRTNEITADVLEEMCVGFFARGFEQIEFVLDQLNTHASLELVELVVRLCGLRMPAASKIATMAQRQAWLGRVRKGKGNGKRIVFHYTPKHASWLNPIEAWFSMLTRKVLQRGSFASQDDLDAAVRRFVTYFNEKLAKPYNLKPWMAAA